MESYKVKIKNTTRGSRERIMTFLFRIEIIHILGDFLVFPNNTHLRNTVNYFYQNPPESHYFVILLDIQTQPWPFFLINENHGWILFFSPNSPMILAGKKNFRVNFPGIEPNWFSTQMFLFYLFLNHSCKVSFLAQNFDSWIVWTTSYIFFLLKYGY